jgi:hypothetical protein
MRFGWLAVAWVGMAGLAGAGAAQEKAAAANAPATRPFVISKETTYYTKPLRADGTIDYVEAINERLSQGVTRENNAAIPLLVALTRGRGEHVGHYIKVWDKLGGEPDAKTDLGNPPINEPVGMDFAEHNPWTAEKAPEVAKWLEAWNPRLDLVVEASRRTQFYMPLVREHETDSSVAVLLPQLNYFRGTINALKARALLRLGNEDMEGFVRDALAIVRIGRLSCHSATIIERLVGMGVEAVGLQTIQIAATGGWLSAAQVDQILAELRALPAEPMYEGLEMGERSFMLEFLQTAAVHGVGEAAKMLDLVGGPQRNRNQAPAAAPLPPTDPSAKDWNAALRRANAWYDRLAAAGRHPTFAQRKRASEEIARDVEAMRARQDGWRGLFTPIEDRALVMVLPGMNRAYLTEARVQSVLVMTQVTLALSSFRAKTGEYPAALRELVPTYFKAEPVDPLTDQPPVYRPEGGGYVLRSLGADGRADDGPKSDDTVLRAER